LYYDLCFFLFFYFTLFRSCFSQRCDLLACEDFDIVAKPLGCVRVTSPVLRKAGIKINGRADVMSTVRSSKDINPSHINACQGGGSKYHTTQKASGADLLSQ